MNEIVRRPHPSARKNFTALSGAVVALAVAGCTVNAVHDAAGPPTENYRVARIGVLTVDASPVTVSSTNVAVMTQFYGANGWSYNSGDLGERGNHPGESVRQMMEEHGKAALTGTDPHHKNERSFANSIVAETVSQVSSVDRGGRVAAYVTNIRLGADMKADPRDALKSLEWMKSHGVRVVAINSDEIRRHSLQPVIAHAQALDMIVLKGKTGDLGLGRSAALASYAFAISPDLTPAKLSKNIGHMLAEYVSPTAELGTAHRAAAMQARVGPPTIKPGASLGGANLSERLSATTPAASERPIEAQHKTILGANRTQIDLVAPKPTVVSLTEPKPVVIKLTEPKPIIVDLAEKTYTVSHVEGQLVGPKTQNAPAATAPRQPGPNLDRGNGR